ncbi:MAG: UDP-3-O-(3-hydroxymyristoyl)glucosamine N-acyltransferase [Nitrospinota bacterium]|nr:UDP-3-O-(3-hydroxymyristoyl)glucosamine N-acyltransferase [Nitrospinota bacterium]
MRLDELAAALGLSAEGNGAVVIKGAASLESAGPGDLSFIKSEKQVGLLAGCGAGALVAPAGVAVDRPAIRAEDPLHIFSLALELLYPQKTPEAQIHPTAWVAPDASLAENVYVGPHASIGSGTRIGKNSTIGAGARIGAGCQIGEDCHIHENAVVMDRVVMGDRCVLHPLSVVGSDGFGYVRLKDGSSRKILHIGDVRLEDDVEIGACSSVDRGMLGSTLIKKGVKIDNQVQVAHNVEIGENTIICGCAGVAGSVVIGKNVMIGGAVAVSDHVRVADGVMIAGLSGVYTDLEKPGVYAGPMAMKNMEYKRFLLSGKRLDRLEAKVKDLAKKKD